MFTFKKRASTLKKLSKIETIHSFYQERANFKNALSLTLRKSCKNFCSTPQKNDKNQTVPSQKLDILAEISCPSLLKNKKISFQRLLENRKILNERGKKINQMQSKHRLKMIALQEYCKDQRKGNNEYLWRNAGIVKVKLGKNIIKTDISCRGLSFQVNETSYDENIQTIRKIKRIRNDCVRMTEPSNPYKRTSTMPDYKQDIDITICPWEAAE